MPQIINTNITSLTTQRNLNSSQSDSAQAMNRLSSGLRINSAKDDAAGMAISTRFDSQIKGLNVATRNAGDGVSLAQTAEGGLDSMTSSLQRLRELAVQSANATNSGVDRAALNEEAQQLISEIDRVSQETNFNGVKLLNGGFEAQTFQVGANVGETIDVSVGKVTVDNLGVSDTGGVSARGSANALANGDLIINGVDIAATTASDDSASSTAADQSAIAKAAAINKSTSETGVTATADENVASGSNMTTEVGTTVLTLNNVDINLGTTGDTATSRASVISAINAVSDQTGVTAVDTGEDGSGVNLVAADGRNIDVSFGTFTGAITTAGEAATATGLAAAGTTTGGYTLTSDNPITITGGDNTGTGNLANSGLQAGTYESGVANVSSTAQTYNGGGSTLVGTGTFDAAADFSGTSLVFDVQLGSETAVTVTLTANGASLAATAGTIQAAIQAAGGEYTNVTVADDGNGQLIFTDEDGGSTDEFTLSWTSGTAGDLSQLGLDTFTSAAGGPPDALNAGDLTINGVSIAAAQASDDTASYTDARSSDKTAGGIAIAAAINKSSESTGVTATLEATTVVGGASTSAGTAGNTGAIHLNGVEISLTVQADAAANRTHAVDQINAVSGQTGITAEDNGKSLTLTAADGRNIVAALDTNAASGSGIAATDFGLAGAGISATDITDDAAGVTAAQRKTEADLQANTTSAVVTLSSAGEIDLQGGTNGTAGIEGLGLEVGTFGGAADGTFLKDVDISTVAGANDALKAVDNALQQVNTERAKLGAIQNRFEATISSNQINSENLSAANSRIRDADFAAETAAMSRASVLQQAGISILAQANAQPQQALSLLG